MEYSEIKEIEARGRAAQGKAFANARARLAYEQRRDAAETPCWDCGADLGPQVDGDVTMCTRCGQWHETCVHPFGGDLNTGPINPRLAAELAREPVDPDRLFWAMDKAAAAMRPESYYAAQDDRTFRRAG